MQDVVYIESYDILFCGIRADHFCIEFGYLEQEEQQGDYPNYVVITANHKGSRAITGFCLY